MRILMVCLGNICRSPLAEGIMAYHAKAAGLDWEIDSAGTGSWHTGEPPHPMSRKVALKNGIDISYQKARTFRKEDLLEFDKIFVMDQQNYSDVQFLSGNNWDPEKVDLLLNLSHPGSNKEVPDPWSHPEEKYHEVFALIDHACRLYVESYLSQQANK